MGTTTRVRPPQDFQKSGTFADERSVCGKSRRYNTTWRNIHIAETLRSRRNMSVRHTAPLLISGAEKCQLVSLQARQYSPVPATPQPLTQLWCPPAVNKLAVVLRHSAARAEALCGKIDESVFGDAVQLLQRSPVHERVHTPNTTAELQRRINKAASGGICDEDREGEDRLIAMKEDVTDIVGVHRKWTLNNVRTLQDTVEVNFSMSGKRDLCETRRVETSRDEI